MSKPRNLLHSNDIRFVKFARRLTDTDWTQQSLCTAWSNHEVLAHLAGKRITEMVGDNVKLSHILTRKAFENAVRINGAIGGSTNAVVHLLAIAGRIGAKLEIDDWDKLGRDVPCLVDLMPSGRFLMEDFYYAGGLPVVMKELLDRGLLHGDAMTVSGRTVAENVADAACWNREVIHSMDDPFKPQGGIVVLRGNLAPGGAVLKPSAATPALMQHRGRAVVFETIEHFKERVDDPALDIDESCVMVLKNCGPRGYPGMAEVGNMPLPEKLLKKGVRDMVRISDGRMSGTAYGTVVLHTAPEAALGGPLGLVRTGDPVELDVAARTLHLDVPEAELARREHVPAAAPPAESGWEQLYRAHVEQADRGAGLDFLAGVRGSAVARESH